MVGSLHGNNMSIKDMAYYERPREKAGLYGLENLTNAELLAILISTGSKSGSALDIANRLLEEFNGINGVIKASTKELTRIKGISVPKALRILSGLYLYERALLENAKLNINNGVKSIADYFINKIGKLNQEVGYVVVVDKKDRVLKIIELFKGGEHSLNASYELVFKEVKGLSDRFYFVHNHPSGIIEPSKQDLEFTSKMDIFSTQYNLELVDHLIVNASCYCSIKNYMKNYISRN